MVDGLTELMAFGADPKIGWTGKKFTPKEVYDLRFLKELAPEHVKASGF